MSSASRQPNQDLNAITNLIVAIATIAEPGAADTVSSMVICA